MTDEYIPTTDEVKARQHRTLLLFAAAALIVSGVLYYFVSDDTSNRPQKTDAASFSSPVSQMNTQPVVMERMQNKLKEQERKMAEMSQQMIQIKNNDKQKSLETDPEYQALQKQNRELQAELQAKNEAEKRTSEGVTKTQGEVFSTIPGPRIHNGSTSDRDDAMEQTGIDNDELHLQSLSTKPKKNPDSFVSAGTFAEAIMLGAADASAGVQAQSNPSPMLFRVIADGTLPNHQKSHLKDCVVTAAVVGDISSERGQIRLERMSCTFPNGEIVEQPVEGTVFGMDAKSGVRGNPVWREGALLGRAAVAGTLSGLGSAIAETYTTNSISPLGTTQTVNNGDIFKFGAAHGASNAMEKLAEYNIRRAEQYHPVIQLSAGQSVDIVFLKGFYLDGRHHEENEQEKIESSSLFPANSHQTPSGLTLSERDLEKIKQHEVALGWGNKNQSGGLS